MSVRTLRIRGGLLVATAGILALVAPSAGAVDPWGDIAGRVTDIAGNPIEDICADVYDLNERVDLGLID